MSEAILNNLPQWALVILGVIWMVTPVIKRYFDSSDKKLDNEDCKKRLAEMDTRIKELEQEIKETMESRDKIKSTLLMALTYLETITATLAQTNISIPPMPKIDIEE